MVLNALKRVFGRGTEGPASVSPAEAELRLKSLKARLMKNKGEAKRLSSENAKVKNLAADKKAANKARLKELEVERKDILGQMKSLRKRLPSK